ncbi:MAG TPA: DNA polymerase III subunit delta' [Dehalococcoidia bacterium]|nr:DNA polymerase III subunit delta' [Dehalococcoidia bacterium]
MWRVIGQEKVLPILQNNISKHSLPHAILISGPPHVGKMTLAVDIARAINCERDDPPCGECEACLKIENGKHSDVQVISLISQNNDSEEKTRTEISIDDIRQIQHMVSLPPFEGKRKVFIIEGAEVMSMEAANCLLKTLEEPVTQSVFILLTTNIGLIPETIASRCQEISLHPIAATIIENTLLSVYDIDKENASLISRLSSGCFGWAISAVQEEKYLEKYYETRNKAIEITTAGLHERFVYAATLSTQFARERAIVYDVLDIWLNVWRDVLLLKIGLTDSVSNIDLSQQLEQWAECMDISDIRCSIQAIQETRIKLNLNANSRLALEVMMLDIPVIIGDIVKR